MPHMSHFSRLHVPTIIKHVRCATVVLSVNKGSITQVCDRGTQWLGQDVSEEKVAVSGTDCTHRQFPDVSTEAGSAVSGRAQRKRNGKKMSDDPGHATPVTSVG